MQLIECVPNFSEGRNSNVINAIATSIRAIAGVKLLHIDVGYDAHRSVYTFAGEPHAVMNAAFASIVCATKLIDMRVHHGTHPRIGACDVCPIVPISGITMDECKLLAETLALKVSSLGIPVYMYAQNARSARRKNLSYIRNGEYELLSNKMLSEDGKPDYGGNFNPHTGATVIGARSYMLAYNINLGTEDVAIAKDIASRIRESSTLPSLNIKYERLPAVKAIGWYVKEYSCVQVSTNVYDIEKVGMHEVYESVKYWASYHNVEVHGSELIGLSPLSCIIQAGKYYNPNAIVQSTIIKSAIDGLGLQSVQEFIPEKKILEIALKN